MVSRMALSLRVVMAPGRSARKARFQIQVRAWCVVDSWVRGWGINRNAKAAIHHRRFDHAVDIQVLDGC
jgi:hypothetical protein